MGHGHCQGKRIFQPSWSNCRQLLLQGPLSNSRANPPERERFKRSIIDILAGEAQLDQLLEARLRADTKPPKLKVETRLRFDTDCSPTSTLLEVITQARPGLLHSISATLAAENLSIEVALIDTEGAMAHDVFYLTSGGMKLTRDQQRAIEWAVTTEIAESLPSNL